MVQFLMMEGKPVTLTGQQAFVLTAILDSWIMSREHIAKIAERDGPFPGFGEPYAREASAARSIREAIAAQQT